MAKKTEGQEPVAAGEQQAMAPQAEASGLRAVAADLEVQVRALEHKVGLLKAALEPFSKMPDQFDKPADGVLYQLVRSSGQAKITCGDIRTALLAMEL